MCFPVDARFETHPKRSCTFEITFATSNWSTSKPRLALLIILSFRVQKRPFQTGIKRKH